MLDALAASKIEIVCSITFDILFTTMSTAFESPEVVVVWWKWNLYHRRKRWQDFENGPWGAVSKDYIARVRVNIYFARAIYILRSTRTCSPDCWISDPRVRNPSMAWYCRSPWWKITAIVEPDSVIRQQAKDHIKTFVNRITEVKNENTKVCSYHNKTLVRRITWVKNSRE